jgi:hypothetical protein
MGGGDKSGGRCTGQYDLVWRGTWLVGGSLSRSSLVVLLLSCVCDTVSTRPDGLSVGDDGSVWFV